MEGRYKLKGIRSLLEEWYWPKEEKKRFKGGSRGGKFTGSLVDREIMEWAQEGHFTYLPTRKIHKYTYNLIRFFIKNGWRPYKAQYPVGSRAFGSVATAIDLMLHDTEGHLIIVEIKCGYDGYWLTPNGQMSAPFADIPNTPCAQAMAQLIFGHFLLTRTQPHMKPKYAYVLNVNKTEVTPYVASKCEWAKRLIPDLGKHIQERVEIQRTRPPKAPAAPVATPAPKPKAKPKPTPKAKSPAPTPRKRARTKSPAPAPRRPTIFTPPSLKKTKREVIVLD